MLLSDNFDSLNSSTAGIDGANVGRRLLANIEERNLWNELLEVQTLDRPDVLSIKFKKLDSPSYTRIELLAHGQKCTAILVILLADGVTPVLVDQPEMHCTRRGSRSTWSIVCDHCADLDNTFLRHAVRVLLSVQTLSKSLQ